MSERKNIFFFVLVLATEPQYTWYGLQCYSLSFTRELYCGIEFGSFREFQGVSGSFREFVAVPGSFNQALLIQVPGPLNVSRGLSIAAIHAA